MKMSKMDLMRGIGIGLIAGSTIGVAMHSDKRKMRKIKGRALRTVGTVMETMSDVFTH